MAKSAIVQITMTFRKPALQANPSNFDTQSPGKDSATDLWAIFRALRDAHKHYGLRSGQLQTLQAMLSVLKPGQGYTVFASNSELCRRIGGIDERTLRRHIERFVKLGFMERHDSPNHKRYRLRSSEGASLSFGVSLRPFFQRTAEILEVARQVQQDQRDRLFLRKKILTQLARIDEVRGESEYTKELRKTLRRRLQLGEYQAIWTEVKREIVQMSTAVDSVKTTILPANDGQNVRQLSKSKKESIDTENPAPENPPNLRLLKAVCKEACSFTQRPIQDWNDVEVHARTLAPMMGIDSQKFQTAAEKLGAWKASSAIFILLQMGHRIRNFAAYFCSLTNGNGISSFNPERLLNKMAQATAAQPT